MGLLPGALPGYSPLGQEEARRPFESAWKANLPKTPGKDIRSIIEGIKAGDVKALLVFGSNPARTFGVAPDALAKLDLLFVAELFPTETARLADIVVPAATFAEKAGTITNTCGQVQPLRRTLRKPGTRSDLETILALARLMGHPWPYQSADDVLREIVACVPGYSLSLPALMAGRACATEPAGNPPPLERTDLIFSSRDTLFTSGTLSRFSASLNSVDEARKAYGYQF